MRDDSTITTTGRCPACGAEVEPRYITWDGQPMRVGWKDCPNGCMGRLDDKRRERTFTDTLMRAGVKRHYLNATSDRKDLLDEVANGGSLYINGAPRTGKTYLAAAIAASVIKSGGMVRMVSTTELFEQLRATFDSHEETEAGVMGRLKKADLLILDDLGTETAKPYVLERIYELIDARICDEKPLVITSNLKLGELAARLAMSGDAMMAEKIAARIKELCRNVPFTVESRQR